MNQPLTLLLAIIEKIAYVYFLRRPKVTVEADVIFEDAGGSSNVGGTFWRLWKDIYLNVCVTNTGAPATVKRAFISMKKNGVEMIRFSPMKTLKYICFNKDFYKSPELEKALVGARINTNDSWGPHIVVFTAFRDGKEEDLRLSDCESSLTVEVVGQKPKCIPLKVSTFP